MQLSTSSIRPRFARGSCRIPFLRVAVCLTCVLLFVTSCGKKSGPSVNPDTAGPHLKWKCKIAGFKPSDPALGPDGTIYVSTFQGLRAISPDGKLLWQTALNRPLTPVVSDDGAIYLSLEIGIIFGVSKDGQLVWRPGYGLTSFGAPPALGPGTTLYYMDGVGDIFAFLPRRSEQSIWSLETFREGILGQSAVLPGTARVNAPIVSGAPIVTRDGSIILPRQNFLDSISSSGSLQWDLELSSGWLERAALADDGTIYVGDTQGALFAVDAFGSKKWRFDSNGVMSSPVIDKEGVIYFTDGKAVFALNPDGSLKWRFSPSLRFQFSTPPTLAADGTLYAGGESALIALHPNGTLKWNLHVDTPLSSVTIAPDGTIFFPCGDQWLCAVEDSGSPLMRSAWPKQFHDAANTSNSMQDAK